jgi:hypothetical protein
MRGQSKVARLFEHRICKKRLVFARARIGNGPWYNATGDLIAAKLTDLHLYNKTITLQTALDENGQRIKGRGDKPNEHDILNRHPGRWNAIFPARQKRSHLESLDQQR